MAIYHPDVVIKRGGGWSRFAGCAGMIVVVIISLVDTLFKTSDLLLFTLRLIGTISFWFFFDIFKYDHTPKEWVKNSFEIYIMHCIIVKTIKLVY